MPTAPPERRERRKPTVPLIGRGAVPDGAATAVLTVLAVLVVLALIVAGVLYLPTLLLQPSRHQSDQAESAARKVIAQRMDTYVTQVVAESTGPAGPTTVELADLTDQASALYSADRNGSAPTAHWITTAEPAGGLSGVNNIIEGYTIAFHDPGTPSLAPRSSTCRTAPP